MKALLLGTLIAAMIASCVVQRFTGPRLTGTCDGACAHYTACKDGHSATDATRCHDECPQVFSDPDSLMAYESLSCPAAVEYVDGPPKKTAATKRR